MRFLSTRSAAKVCPDLGNPFGAARWLCASGIRFAPGRGVARIAAEPAPYVLLTIWRIF